MTNPTPKLPPGFRFHPTDEELILHYLRNHAASSPCPVSIIAEVDIYKFDPWDLPRKAMFGDREWYFFSPRDRKYPNGVRPNRAAGSGYWKATGTDKPILTGKGNESIGVKKALVFYKGKPPKGLKTNWIMHEYRLAESPIKNNNRPMKLKDSPMRLDDWVLCRIYQKGNHSQELPESPPPQETKLDFCSLPKSASLTELFKEADFSLLSRLLEAPIEMPETGHDTFCYANWNQQVPFCNTNQSSETEGYSSVSVTDNGFKRQRVVEDGGGPSRKSNSSWAYNNLSYNHFDHNQALFNQQMLLKAELGMQWS